jgi:predicted TPR repeat methyltransferase
MKNAYYEVVFHQYTGVFDVMLVEKLLGEKLDETFGTLNQALFI